MPRVEQRQQHRLGGVRRDSGAAVERNELAADADRGHAATRDMEVARAALARALDELGERSVGEDRRGQRGPGRPPRLDPESAGSEGTAADFPAAAAAAALELSTAVRAASTATGSGVARPENVTPTSQVGRASIEPFFGSNCARASAGSSSSAGVSGSRSNRCGATDGGPPARLPMPASAGASPGDTKALPSETLMKSRSSRF